jgi:hypothetical protein
MMTLLERILLLRHAAETIVDYTPDGACQLLRHCIWLEKHSRPARDAARLIGNPQKRRRGTAPRQDAAAWRRKSNARYLLIRRSKELQRLFDRITEEST